MKLARRIGIMLPAIILGLAVLVYGAGYLLPERTHTERATYIDVAPEIVYGLMSDLRQFKQWTPWHDRDPNTGYRVDQPGRGLGATLHWQSQDSVVGVGQLAIIDALPYSKLRILLEYNNGERVVLAYRLEPLEGGTHIAWTLDIDHGEDPVSRYRGWMTARRLTAAFEPGLDRLRRLAERQPVLPAPKIVTEEISYQVDEQSFTGYIAYDQNRQNRPGVLIVYEWRGHNDYARQRAEQLAELGYVALVLDIAAALPTAEEEGQPAEAAKAAFEAAKPHFTAALDRLKAHPAADPGNIAAIGYGFGGNIVLNMARAGVELDGAVSFHGSLEPIGDKAQQGAVKASILVLNGADDPRVPPEQRQAFIKEMDAAGVDYEFVMSRKGRYAGAPGGGASANYPGATHTFTNPAAEAYNAEADKQSWQRMQTFLARIFR